MPVLKCKECSREIYAPTIILSKHGMVAQMSQVKEAIKSIHRCAPGDWNAIDYKGILFTDTETYIDGAKMGELVKKHNQLIEEIKVITAMIPGPAIIGMEPWPRLNALKIEVAGPKKADAVNPDEQWMEGHEYQISLGPSSYKTVKVEAGDPNIGVKLPKAVMHFSKCACHPPEPSKTEPDPAIA